MYRKVISFVLGSAIAITAVTASSARANGHGIQSVPLQPTYRYQTNRNTQNGNQAVAAALAGVAALFIIGKTIEQNNKRRKQEDEARKRREDRRHKHHKPRRNDREHNRRNDDGYRDWSRRERGYDYDYEYGNREVDHRGWHRHDYEHERRRRYRSGHPRQLLR